jgi:transcriptional regulator GlxA family with amidase domain
MSIPPQTITPDAGLDNAPALNAVIVCGGIDIQHSVTREHLHWLQSQARQGRQLGAVCTGSWALAKAGLLDGYDCSVHWECLASMQEAFPRAAITTRLFSIDRNRNTATGGTAPLDMMLHLIAREHGRELAAAISEMFICERIRNEQDHQRVPLKHVLGTNQPKLQEIVALMEANLEEPIDLDELACYVDVSRRQLERLFQKYLHCSPSRYYLKLRLIRARQLLKQTTMSIIEVAAVCGFVSTPHFSKCYREYFGIPPSNERAGHQGASVVALLPIPGELHGGAQSMALSRAQGESSYASVRL